MSTFVLKGCETRCKDVYSILWSLGGRGDCCGIYPFFYYYILPNGNIIGTKNILDESWVVFTLEEFEKTYPYKVGDKVIYKNTVYVVIGMEWNGDEICYRIDYGCGYPSSGIRVGELQPYKEKEETMEKNEHLILDCILTDKGHELVPHEDYEIKQEGDKYYLVKKKAQYPKTYKECCEVLGMQSSLFLHLSSMDIDGEVEEKSYGYKIASQMNCLYELLVCRDAYWKIAGKWKPNYGDGCDTKYIITTAGSNETYKDVSVVWNYVLIFPTEEMRDAFYENFKDLIESCKELL